MPEKHTLTTYSGAPVADKQKITKREWISTATNVTNILAFGFGIYFTYLKFIKNVGVSPEATVSITSAHIEGGCHVVFKVDLKNADKPLEKVEAEVRVYEASVPPPADGSLATAIDMEAIQKSAPVLALPEIEVGKVGASQHAKHDVEWIMRPRSDRWYLFQVVFSDDENNKWPAADIKQLCAAGADAPPTATPD